MGPAAIQGLNAWLPEMPWFWWAESAYLKEELINRIKAMSPFEQAMLGIDPDEKT